LAERFPACFKVSGPRLPLKIGVDRDVISAAPDLNADDVRWAIRNYVSSATYSQAMVEGATRFDLNGASVGVVTASQAKWATLKNRQHSSDA